MNRGDVYDHWEEFEAIVRAWSLGDRQEASAVAAGLRERLALATDPTIHDWLIPRLDAFLAVVHRAQQGHGIDDLSDDS